MPLCPVLFEVGDHRVEAKALEARKVLGFVFVQAASAALELRFGTVDAFDRRRAENINVGVRAESGVAHGFLFPRALALLGTP